MALTHDSRRNIRTVFIKELRDVLRDRRTLFAAIILPVIINPLLFIGLFTLMSSQTAKQRSQDFTVAIGGSEHGPTVTKIIENYEPPQSITQPVNIPAGKSLRPDDIVELPPADPEVPDSRHPVTRIPITPPPAVAPGIDVNGFEQHLDDLLEPEAAANVRGDDNGIAVAFWRYDRNHDGQLDAHELWRIEAMKQLRLGVIDVAVILPENFESNLHAGVTSQRPEVLYLGSSDSSDTASGHIRRLLNGFVEPWTPMELASTDVKTGSKGIKEVSRFIPYIIILMVLMAAFTPAIDLMAGEKERGTIETLLISPSDRKEIITGKFLTVATIAIAAAALNLASLGFTVMYIGGRSPRLPVQAKTAASQRPMEPAGTQITDEARERLRAEAAASATAEQTPDGEGDGEVDGTQTAPVSGTGDDTPAQPLRPPAGSAQSPFPEIPFYLYPVILLLMVPAAGLFGAVALAISSFARSYREGQQYIGPVTLVAIPLSMISLLPGIDFNWQWGLVPISNFALLFRDIMTTISAGDPLSSLQWIYVAEVTIVTGIYAWLALRWATSIFYREDILFREAEEFNWRFWQRPGPPRPTPSAGSGLFAFVVSLIAFFFVGQSWQIAAMSAEDPAGSFLRAHVMTHALLIALPCILLAALNKYDWKTVFRITRLPLVPIGAVLMISVGLGIGMIEVQQLIAKNQPELLGGQDQLSSTLGQLSPWVALFALALVPAISEEILFRGYVLSGMVPDKIKQGRTRNANGAIPTPWKAILLTAVLFGIMHLQPIRIPLTAVGGIVLCWIAWRTRSLILPMIGHLTYNGFIVGGSVFTETVTVDGTDVSMPLVARLIDADTQLVSPLWLAIGAVLLIGGIVLMIRLTRELQFEPWEAETRDDAIQRVTSTRRSNPSPAADEQLPETPTSDDPS